MNVEWHALGSAVAVAMLGYFVFQLVRFGGLKGVMFGARIRGTPGQVDGRGNGGFSKVKVRVHELEGGGPEREIGLELATTAFARFSISTVRLTASEARKLARIIDAAAQ